jgi:hypothetical protein
MRSYRLGLPDKELVIDLVHDGEVAHVGQEHVHLDDVLEAASGCLEDGRQVAEYLALARVSPVLLSRASRYIPSGL